jgi:hypothetical protein
VFVEIEDVPTDMLFLNPDQSHTYAKNVDVRGYMHESLESIVDICNKVM